MCDLPVPLMSEDAAHVAQRHAAELQDLKDKAKAFIKRKVEQLTQDHASALASSEQQISHLICARNLAVRERDELLIERDRLREELRASASSVQSTSIMPSSGPPQHSSAQYSEELDQLRRNLEVLRTELNNSRRQHAEVVDAASAADVFRQKQLDAEKEKHAAELHEVRMRAESAISEVQARFSAALEEAKIAALNVTAADEKVAATNESTRLLTERNVQLERESRELLQVLQEKDAMVVRCAEEVATVKLQAKSAAAKFSERARAEKSALMVEIKQLQDTLSIRDEELKSALGARAAEGNEAAQTQVDLESLKLECASLREEAAAAIQGRNFIKSEYDTYKKRVHSVLAEQDLQYNRVIELERLVHASALASDAKSKELQRAHARIAEMEAIAAQETNVLHALRQQLADTINARDVARVREQASEARTAALESRIAALEAAHTDAAASAVAEIQSMQTALNALQQDHTELQSLLQHKEAESVEMSRSAAAEVANLAATMVDLQKAYNHALIQLEKLKGDNSCSTVASIADNISPSEHRTFESHSVSVVAPISSRQRYPQPSLENLLLDPPPSSSTSSVRPSSALAHASSELDLQHLHQHVAALELQVSTLRDALRDAQDQCSLFEKQCNWFKKRELEIQLSQDRNSSASDLDYLRSVVASYMESHDPSVIPAIAQALKMTKEETQRLQSKHTGFLSSFW